MTLAPRAHQTLIAIARYLHEHGQSPSYRELVFLLGMKTTSTVAYHVGALERSGVIKRAPYMSYSLELTPAAQAFLPDELRVIALTLPVPPSVNTNWKPNNRGGMYKSDEAKQYQQEVSILARQAGIFAIPFADGEIKVTVRWYRARQSGDLDNRLKVLWDALNGVLWTDDAQVGVIHAERYEDARNPRIEIEVTRRAMPARSIFDARKDAA